MSSTTAAATHLWPPDRRDNRRRVHNQERRIDKPNQGREILPNQIGPIHPNELSQAQKNPPSVGAVAHGKLRRWVFSILNQGNALYSGN